MSFRAEPDERPVIEYKRFGRIPLPFGVSSHADEPLLTVRDLAVSFRGASGQVSAQAVDGVSFTVYPRQTLTIVGESGCGKSVTALSLLRLLASPPAHIDRGSAMFRSAKGMVDLLAMSDREIRGVRGGQIAMIFQEPMTSLNPVFTIGEQIAEAVRIHRGANRREAREIAIRALGDVGISRGETRFDDYPHQFSGGMRQRVMIAMALACRPRLLLADEPTTALDATVQQQILALMGGLKERRSDGEEGLAILLITHDLGLVAEHADAVCVMYAGRVVEYASAGDLFAGPLHPYTRALLACVPRLTDRRERLQTIAEVMGRADAFATPARAPAGSRAWWPAHPPPEGSSGQTVLYEAAPTHWVALWRTGDLGAQTGIPDVGPLHHPTTVAAQGC